MFFKYASNLLQHVSNECMLKSFACKDDDAVALYRNISSRIDGLIRRIGVENTGEIATIEND
ncbi:hypothetical protein M0R72_01755 [Candidatus Pacearchaeota archaeon]|jgi:hypothetical protein|nr:hypothetical protein [Candidatus Pacearchaeota archaeon]